VQKGILLVFVLFSATLFLLLPMKQGLCREEPITTGDRFPETNLPAPVNSTDRLYLGLPEGQTFFLNQVKTDAVLLEVLNVHCAHCQRQVEFYNKLYDLIEKDPAAKDHIKILSFAVGNDEAEVTDFREKFKVPYPVIPDPKFMVAKALGATRAPFSVYIRQDTTGKTGVVSAIHEGVDPEYKQAFKNLVALSETSPLSLQKKVPPEQKNAPYVKPVLSQAELQSKLKSIFTDTGGVVVRMEKVALESGRNVYFAVFKAKSRFPHLFAEVISRAVPCDSCHDVHFIYIFDGTGKIIRFEPFQISKLGNRPWNTHDVTKMRQRIEGKHLFDPFVFNSKVDAVSSATISSAVIFNSLGDGQALYQELKGKGLL
jgi:hypothetical protein